MGLTVEGGTLRPHAPLCRENSGFREIGDKYDRKCTFPYRKRHAAGTLFAGYFFDFRGVGDPVGFVVHTSAFTAHSSAIPENSGFSENLTRTLGTITCAGRGGGNLQACHPRTRTFGS